MRSPVKCNHKDTHCATPPPRLQNCFKQNFNSRDRLVLLAQYHQCWIWVYFWVSADGSWALWKHTRPRARFYSNSRMFRCMWEGDAVFGPSLLLYSLQDAVIMGITKYTYKWSINGCSCELCSWVDMLKYRGKTSVPFPPDYYYFKSFSS